ncbi:hypothetical protein D3C76_1080210 [compost metagenome]
MAGGNERHGDFLADEVPWRIDPRAVAGYQGFGGADLGGDQEGFHWQLACGCGGQWAGAQVADLHIAGGHGCDDFGATVEFAPIDTGLAGFFVVAVGLGDLRRVNGGLVGDGQVGGLGKEARTRQGESGKQAQRGRHGHRKAPGQGVGVRLTKSLNDLKNKK